MFKPINSEAERLLPPRLRRGDRVRFVSPASTPERESVAEGARIVESWGLIVEIGAHAFDRNGHYLAGKDEHRLADFNEALRDPGVRAIFATVGGKGSYRITHGLDFAAAYRDPKPVIGFSDVTIPHLALLERMPHRRTARTTRCIERESLWARFGRFIEARSDGAGAAHDPSGR